MPRRSPTPFAPPPHEPALPRMQRRATGVYYTPPEIVRLIVELTLGSQSCPKSGPLAPRVHNLSPATQPLRILDPACGAGEFLAAAYRHTVQAGTMATFTGIDIDPVAVATARLRLPEIKSESGVENLMVGDALDDARLLPASFDAIIGNPPYVNIRQLAKALPRADIDRLRERYQTARGNFDLYVVFIERSLELLRPGGRCGLIVPNKWATLDYARPCRELLLKHATLERAIDLSDIRAFAAASVYPHVLVFRKQPPPKNHAVLFGDGIQPTDQHPIPQRLLAPAAISFTAPLDVESRVPTCPLGDFAKLSCGTAGFSAQRIASELIDAADPSGGRGSESGGRGSRRAAAYREGEALAEPPPLADFITSGNIDRYSIRLGNVRYLNRTYIQPRLPLTSAELTPAKQRLFASPKIVIAGMSRRLEAAWDDRGLALGVQVFAASDCRIDPFYLLALLNSKLLSYLFATRFAAKRLAGGYLAINKGQLARLPVVTPSIPSAGTKPGSGAAIEVIDRLATLARQIPVHPTEQIESEIDRLVYSLYRLADAEVARLEQYFAEPSARAA